MSELQQKFSSLIENCHRHHMEVEKYPKFSLNPFKLSNRHDSIEKYISERNSFVKEFEQILALSEASNTYFAYCSLKVYKSSYKERLEKFLEINSNSFELDFIEVENSNLQQMYHSAPEYLKSFLSNSFSERNQFLDTKKREFLAGYTSNKNSKASKKKGLSNFFTIRVLDHLGIIDFLLEKGYSQEKISKILGEILGKHHQNIRSEITNRSKSISKDKKQTLDDIIKRIDKL